MDLGYSTRISRCPESLSLAGELAAAVLHVLEGGYDEDRGLREPFAQRAEHGAGLRRVRGSRH